MPSIDWLTLAYAGIFLVGIGVVIVCVSAAFTLGTLKKSIKITTNCVENLTEVAEEALVLGKELSDNISKVEKQLEPILLETNILLQNTNILAEDIQEKSEKLNPLFDSTEGFVQTVHSLQNSVLGMKENVDNFKKGTDEKINNVVAKGKESVEKANGLLNKFLKKEKDLSVEESEPLVDSSNSDSESVKL